jgi:hypothetical protein
LIRRRSGDITRSSDSSRAGPPEQITHSRDVFGTPHGHADRIDVRIEVSFSGLDPPEGRAARVSGDEQSAVKELGFVGWLSLLGVLQLLTGEGAEPHRP